MGGGPARRFAARVGGGPARRLGVPIGKLPGFAMDKVRNALVILEVVLAILLMAGVLLQTPKATGLGGTIGGGGDGGLGGGYRTRRGLERQIYMTTWVLVAAFLIVSVANIWVTTHAK
jgi:protein translocase SecG subunit